MTRHRIALLLLMIGLSGCGDRSTSNISPPLGRSLGADPASLRRSPAPTGDPPAERDGTVAQGQAAAENEPTHSSIAPSPQAALRRYALHYTNWRAASLVTHERELASLATGAARNVAEETAASESGAAGLAADHVRNQGVVLTIAPGHGPARGEWVVVTQEQTLGTGPYAGLPSSPHVTLAQTARSGPGWTVSEWRPQS